MPSRIAIRTIVVATVLAAAGGLAIAASRWQSVRAHLDRGETRLLIFDTAGAQLRLFRAGDTLDDARAVPLTAAEIWLGEGNYFLEATLAERVLLYPVPLIGGGEGPAEDGSFPVTIRRLGFGEPPTLEAPGLAPATQGRTPGTHERTPDMPVRVPNPPAPRWAFVPGGHFALGDLKNPGESHFVFVTAFFAGVVEVTNGEFRRFLGDAGGYDDASNWTEAGWAWRARGTSRATARLDPTHPDHGRFGRDELPVVLVTWHEASAYCRWLTKRLGGGKWLFRLPTEAEWEKMARGPDGFDYGLGMRFSEPEAGLYNWRKNPGAEVTLVGFAETQSRYRPNRFGVYHASGNAGEWTQSVSRPFNRRRPYADDDRNHDTAAGLRVTRGGSWYSATTSRLQAAYREEFQPELSSDDLGFRVVALPLP